MGSLSGFAKEKHPQVHFPNEFAGSVRPVHVWEGPLVPDAATFVFVPVKRTSRLLRLLSFGEEVCCRFSSVSNLASFYV